MSSKNSISDQNNICAEKEQASKTASASKGYLAIKNLKQRDAHLNNDGQQQNFADSSRQQAKGHTATFNGEFAQELFYNYSGPICKGSSTVHSAGLGSIEDFAELDQKTMDTEKKASQGTMPGNKSGKSSNSSNLQNFDLAPSLRFKDSRSLAFSS